MCPPKDGGKDKNGIQGGATRSKSVLLLAQKAPLFNYLSHPLISTGSNQLKDRTAHCYRSVLRRGGSIPPPLVEGRT